MVVLRKWKQKKQLALSIRCLSTLCQSSGIFRTYFLHYEYNYIDKFFSKPFWKGELKQWGIHDSASFQHTIRFLLEEGTRREYERVCHEITALPFTTQRNLLTHIESLVPPEEVEEEAPVGDGYFKYELKNQLVKEHPYYAKLYTANYGKGILPDAGIAAFDVAWCIRLCRIGRNVGYLTKEEEKELMMQAIRVATHCYSNWNEYLLGFNIGCLFNESIETYKKHIGKNKHKDTARYMAAMFGGKHPLVEKVPWDNLSLRASSA